MNEIVTVMELIQTQKMVLVQNPMDRQMYQLSPEDARRPMSFKRAVRLCWDKYIDFDGRARRSEFWWFSLFTSLILLLPLAFSLVMVKAFEGATYDMELLGSLVGILMFLVIGFAFLVLILPAMAVTTRRLHDVGLSGWWLVWNVALAVLAPVVLTMAYSFIGAADSSAGVSDIEMLRSVFHDSIPLFAVVATIYLADIVVSLAVLVFTLLDSQKKENKYGPSPKYSGE